MKILFVLENYIPHIGGVEIVFKILMEGLVKLGHDVTLVTHRIKNTKKYEVLNGVKIHRVNCFHSRYAFTFFAIPKVMKLAKGVDLIHTTTYNAAFPARIAAFLRRKPSIITVHEVLGDLWKQTEVSWFSAKLLRLLEWVIIKLRFSKYVCVSNSTKKQVLNNRIKKDKVVTIFNGVDYDFWNPAKYDDMIKKRYKLNDNFVYLFFGRPGVSKGLEYLIKAVPDIVKKVPNAKLFALVSKDDTYKKRYEYIMNLIKKLGIKNNVIMHDSVPRKDLPWYVNMADCVVVPSLTEGFGFTTAESCSLGKVVVASNTTSLPEVISGKYKLVKVKSAAALSSAIIDVANGKFDKKPLKKFLIKDNIDNYLKLYESLL